MVKGVYKILFFVFLLGALDCYAQSSVVEGYFLDDKKLNVEDLRNKSFEELKGGNFLNIGNTKKHLYLKINPEKNELGSYLYIGNNQIDSLTYIFKKDGSWQKRISGQAVPFKYRLFGYQDFVFELKNDSIAYLRLKSTKPLAVPFRVVSKNSLLDTYSRFDILFGGFIGVIIVMILYNFMIFILTRDVNYLFYVIYLFTLGLTQMSILGFSDRFLTGQWPALNKNFVIITGAAVGIASALFIKRFLELRNNNRGMNKAFNAVIALDLVAILVVSLGFSNVAYNVVNMVAFFGSLLAIISAIILIRKGYRPANYFLIAWSVFLLGILIFVLKDYQVVPYNSFSRMSVLIGSIMEVTLLSIALADKINEFRRQKDASQAEALSMAKENERIIKDQNVELEKRVNQRTMELQEANEELQVTLDNLKDTQTQLVDAEKMASLGQLTAGIAHEINNPINFITSNVSPLKRDIDEIYQIADKFSELDENSLSEQIEEARKLKEELEYEYLKEEVDNLVNGISEGAQRTSEIVRGLRTFSRLDEDVVKPANINEGLDSTLVLLKNKTKNNIEVVCNYDEQLPEVECFPGKLNQCFMNILNNAIYAVNHKSYEEGASPTLTLTTERGKDEVKIRLADNGMGMSEETKKKIFDPFFTTKEVGEGTGLGMSIVFQIIDKHNGKLNIESEEGVGTSFIITLPLRQPNKEE